MFKNITIVIITISGILAIVLFVLVGLMYARHNYYLCWTESTKYGRVPADEPEAIVKLVYSENYDEELEK